VRVSRSLAALVLALLVPASAQADFKQSYARGKEAAAGGRWSEVEARMREAIAEQGEAQARVRIYGMRFEPYVPQYYLGLAAYRQGNCAEALRNWRDAGTAQIVAGDSALQGVIDEGVAECRRKSAAVLADKPPPSAPATAPPATATPSASTTQQAPPKPPATTAVSQAPAQTRPLPPPAATQPATTTTRPASAPPPVASSSAPAAAASGSAPPALVAALDAFIAGKFEQSANLDLAGFNDPRARFHALLLRSAARHLLAQAGGERADALLAAAQADIRAARALQPGKTPDAALFSPRYRRLFDSVR
jgi:outer membrane biosynthesis protein TonB